MLNQQQFFHGTTADLRQGDIVEPGHPSTYPEGFSDSRYAYATRNQNDAATYADWASQETHQEPRVYEVTPLGPHEPDPVVDEEGHPRWNFPGDRRSKHGWRVVWEHQIY